MTKSDSPVNPDTENHQKEWEAARDVLKSFDDNLHDLRKYGFSFLTALMGAESILIPKGDMPIGVKFAVFAVTLLLIATLDLMDKDYVIFQEAANTRARVLERELNLELSDVITVRYGRNKMDMRVQIFYLLFMAAVLILSGFVLLPDWGYFGGLVAFAVFVAVMMIIGFKLLYARNDGEDWTISPLECSKDEYIKITLNNLKKGTKTIERDQFNLPDASDLREKSYHVPIPIVFVKHDLIWEIRSEDGKEVIAKKADEETSIYYNYTWIVRFKKAGVYQMRPGNCPISLFTIIVSD